MKGTVNWFNVRKGFGFIKGEDDKDYFVHYSGISTEGFKKLRPGQRVSFEIKSNEKGPLADKVVLEAS